MDETLRTWGKNIQLRREVLNADGVPRNVKANEPSMTQAQLGEMLEPPVHQSTIARWEAGQMEPKRRHKAELARILMTDVAMLFPLTRSAA